MFGTCTKDPKKSVATWLPVTWQFFPGWEDPGSEMGTLQLPPNTQLLGIGFGAD